MCNQVRRLAPLPREGEASKSKRRPFRMPEVSRTASGGIKRTPSGNASVPPREYLDALLQAPEERNREQIAKLEQLFEQSEQVSALGKGLIIPSRTPLM